MQNSVSLDSQLHNCCLRPTMLGTPLYDFVKFTPRLKNGVLHIGHVSETRYRPRCRNRFQFQTWTSQPFRLTVTRFHLQSDRNDEDGSSGACTNTPANRFGHLRPAPCSFQDKKLTGDLFEKRTVVELFKADNIGSGYWILFRYVLKLNTCCRKELKLGTLQNLFADAQFCVYCLNVRK